MLPILCSTGTYTASGTLACSKKCTRYPAPFIADPSENWYQGEIGFDFYIIPLAKLKDCGVFGVSSDEYLNYALKNRQGGSRSRGCRRNGGTASASRAGAETGTDWGRWLEFQL
jgi:hypothetical protein